MVTIRHIRDTDIQAAKRLAGAHSDSLGFVIRRRFEEAVEKQCGLVALEDDRVIGFVLYRHRKRDCQMTLSEICVHQDYRGRQIGRRLMDALIQECIDRSRHFIQLKCPTDLPANEFYRRLGFELIMTEKGKKRFLHVWRSFLPGSSDNKV